MERWAIHPSPRDGELLESWILRLSQANLVSTGSLVNELRFQSVIGARETISHEAFQRLSVASGATVQRIREAHLVTYAEATSRAYRALYTIPGRLKAASAVHLKWCPHCLASDSVPFLRVRWALELTGFCSAHHTVLQDKCPHCGAYFSFDVSKDAATMMECDRCRGSLLESSACGTTNGFDHAIDFQERVLALKTDETVFQTEAIPIPSEAFVRVVQKVFRVVSRIPSARALSRFTNESFRSRVHLLDDVFSLHLRRVNALSITAWLFGATLEQLAELSSFVRSCVSEEAGQHLEFAISLSLQRLQTTEFDEMEYFA